jgi:hypothetical protein
VAKSATVACHAFFGPGAGLYGDNADLIKYLRSGQEFYLPEGACIALASFLDEEPWKQRPGPPRDQDARWACTRAKEIYEAWKEANKKAGVSDWGVRDEMKDESCRYGIAVAGPFEHEPDFETVRQMMDRPRGRQKPYKRRPNKRRIRA